MNNKHWSFAITYGSGINFLPEVVNSIRKLCIPKYEILLIGDTSTIESLNGDDIVKINFDESLKPGWITRKKNILVQNAKYDNIVLQHEYFSYDKNWYKWFLKFHSDWNVCMTRLELPTNTYFGLRYRDWVVRRIIPTISPDTLLPSWIDYKDRSCLNDMYVSGGYWCAKRKFMLDNPLDEELCWGEGEDVEWSERVRQKNKWKYCCNWRSKNLLLKIKDPICKGNGDPSGKWYDEWEKYESNSF